MPHREGYVRPTPRRYSLAHPAIQRSQYDTAVKIIEAVFKEMTEDDYGNLRPSVIICEADVIKIDRALAKLQKLRRVLFPNEED